MHPKLIRKAILEPALECGDWSPLSPLGGPVHRAAPRPAALIGMHPSPHSKRFARFADARDSRSAWTPRVFSAALDWRFEHLRRSTISPLGKPNGNTPAPSYDLGGDKSPAKGGDESPHSKMPGSPSWLGRTG